MAALAEKRGKNQRAETELFWAILIKEGTGKRLSTKEAEMPKRSYRGSLNTILDTARIVESRDIQHQPPQRPEVN